jgi:hypothetical protein
MYDIVEDEIMQAPTRVNPESGILEIVQQPVKVAQVDLSEPIINIKAVSEQDVLDRITAMQTGQSTINMSPIVQEQIAAQLTATEIKNVIEAKEIAENIIAKENPVPVDESGNITQEGIFVRAENAEKVFNLADDILAAKEYLNQKTLQATKELVAIQELSLKGEAMAVDNSGLQLGEQPVTLGEQAAKRVFKSEADIINIINEEKRKAEIPIPPNKSNKEVITKLNTKELSFLDQIVEFIYNKIY